MAEYNIYAVPWHIIPSTDKREGRKLKDVHCDHMTYTVRCPVHDIKIIENQIRVANWDRSWGDCEETQTNSTCYGEWKLGPESLAIFWCYCILKSYHYRLFGIIMPNWSNYRASFREATHALFESCAFTEATHSSWVHTNMFSESGSCCAACAAAAHSPSAHVVTDVSREASGYSSLFRERTRHLAAVAIETKLGHETFVMNIMSLAAFMARLKKTGLSPH